MDSPQSRYEAVIQLILPEMNSLLQQLDELKSDVPAIVSEAKASLRDEVSISVRSVRNLHEQLESVTTGVNENVSAVLSFLNRFSTEVRRALDTEVRAENEKIRESMRNQAASLVAEQQVQFVERTVKPAFRAMMKDVNDNVSRLEQVIKSLETERKKESVNKILAGAIAFLCFALSSLVGTLIARFLF